MQFSISDLEIEMYPRVPCADKQLILHILKDKGAPVDGKVWLELDLDNFSWTRISRPESNDTLFIVEER